MNFDIFFRKLIFTKLFKFRLLYKLYDFDVKKYENNFTKPIHEVNILDQLDKMGNSIIENESSDSDIELKKRKLEEVRRKKEEMLAIEDEEEEREKKKVEYEINLKRQQELIQKRYEDMLARQNRLEELRFQQLQRKIQTHHLLDSNQSE